MKLQVPFTITNVFSLSSFEISKDRLDCSPMVTSPTVQYQVVLIPSMTHKLKHNKLFFGEKFVELEMRRIIFITNQNTNDK